MMKGYHLALAVILAAFGVGCGAPRYEDGQTIEEDDVLWTSGDYDAG